MANQKYKGADPEFVFTVTNDASQIARLENAELVEHYSDKR